METASNTFPKQQVIAGAEAYLQKLVMGFTFKEAMHNECKDLGKRQKYIIEQYNSFLVHQRNVKILNQQDSSSGSSEYLRKLSVVYDLESFLQQLRMSSEDATDRIPITYEQAVDFGLVPARSHESGPDLQPPPQPLRPILLDDSIMDYKYLHDSGMPECLEKSLKKLRCLLRFQIMLLTPDTPLMDETWDAILRIKLVENKEDLLEKIKVALFDVQKSCSPKTQQIEQNILKSIEYAAEKTNEFTNKIGKDRVSAADEAIYELNEILKKLVQFNFQQFFFLLNASDQQLPSFKDTKAMILPLGKTGVGKSTTIQLLAGADMVKNVDTHHIQASPKALRDIPGLNTIVSAGSTQSVTRYCQQIIIEHGSNRIGILDTPGRGDTQGAEVEMSNCISIVRVIQNCHETTFYPVLLFSLMQMGDRLDQFMKEIVSYSNVINKIVDNIQGFSYYFTKYPDAVNKQSLIQVKLGQIKTAFQSSQNHDESVKINVRTMINDMGKKADDGKVISIDPTIKKIKDQDQDKDLKDKIIADILSTNGIKPSKTSFLSVNADKDATDRLNAQITWHKRSFAQLIREDGGVPMAIYKLKELEKVQEQFSKQASGSFFSGYNNIVIETIDYFVDSMKKDVENCLKDIKKGLSRYNELSDKTIDNLRDTLKQNDNINKVKEGGFSQYIKVDPPKQLAAKVLKEIYGVVETFKNINIGDMQWILFFEKILKLVEKFPDLFDTLKNDALKQYQQNADQVLTDFNQIFSNQSFLLKFQAQATRSRALPGMLSGEYAKDQAKKKRAERVSRDVVGVVPQKQNLYPTLVGARLIKISGINENPTQAFEKCMEVLANAKRIMTEQRDANLKKNPPKSEYFNQIATDVDNLIKDINGNLQLDIEEKIQTVIAPMLVYDVRANRGVDNQSKSSGISSDKDVSFLQASLNLIETFKNIAEKHNVETISNLLENVFNSVVDDSIKTFNLHSDAITQQLKIISSDSEILEATHFKSRFEQIRYIRQVHQINAKTSEKFQSLQTIIQQEVHTHMTQIRRNLLKLQKAGQHFHDSVEEEILFEELDHSAQVIRYFGTLLDSDYGTIDYIKVQLKEKFEEIIKKVNTEASVNSLNHPSNWKYIDKVGHMIEEYRHIQRVVSSLEIQLSTVCNLTNSIASEVGQALKVIKDALSLPQDLKKRKLFMTTKDYNEYSTYLMYLKLVIKSQEVYLPSPEILALAYKLQSWVEDSVMSQYDQLNEVFDFLYFRYLLKEGHDQHYRFIPRPAPIFRQDKEEEEKKVADKDNVDDEEFKTQSWEVQEDDDWLVRLKNSCQEVVKVAFVVNYLVKKQVNQPINNSKLPISQLLRPLLEQENMLELFGYIRKTLLRDYYEGLDIKELRQYYSLEDPSESLFYYRQQALSVLRVADMSLDLKDVSDITNKREDDQLSSPSAYQPDIEGNKFAIQTLDKGSYQSLEAAYLAFSDHDPIPPNPNPGPNPGPIDVALLNPKQLYDQGLYDEVKKRLKNPKTIKQIINETTEYIQKDMEKTLNRMKMDLDFFLNAREIQGQRDDDIERMIKVISEDTPRVNVVIEVLGDFMEKDKNKERLQELLGIIKKTFNEIIDKIESLGQSDICRALEELSQIQHLVISIQYMIRQSDKQSKFQPQSDYLWILTQELLEQARQTLTAFEKLVNSFIKKVEVADVETGFSITTLYPKSYFDPLNDLEDRIKGSNITKAVTEHMGVMITKFDEKLNVIIPEETKSNEDRQKFLKNLKKLRDSAKCQAEIVSENIVPKIDKLVFQLKFEIIAIYRLILTAFAQKKPDEIAKILDLIKPLIKEEILIKVQEKFFEMISGLIAIAVKKFGDKETQANLKVLIEKDIPFIQSFLDHPSFQNRLDSHMAYIQPICHQIFKSQVIDQVESIACCAILYVQKQIIAPTQPLDSFDQDLIQARKDSKVQIVSFDQALSTLVAINSANPSLELDVFKVRLASFYLAATQWITSAVQNWHQTIDAYDREQINQEKKDNLVKAMIGLADDLGRNDLNFKKNDFKNAIQAKKQSDAEQGFLSALNNQFYDVKNKERLNQWGVALKDKIIKINFQSMNEKLGNYDRVAFYQNVEAQYQNLSSVASKVGEYNYFSVGGDYSSLTKMQLQVLEETKSKAKELCEMQTASHIVFEDRTSTLNVLERKDTEVQMKIFLAIYESYENLGTLRDTLTILGMNERQDINKAQQDLKEKLFSRVEWLKAQSYELQKDCDPIKIDQLKEFAKILLEMQILKKNFIMFNIQLQKDQDWILNEYEKIQLQKRNRLRLENLRKMIQGQDIGCSIIAECEAFEGDNMKELAKKLATKSVGMVLQQMTGDDTLLDKDTLQQQSNMIGDDTAYLDAIDVELMPPAEKSPAGQPPPHPPDDKNYFKKEPKNLLRWMFAKFNLSYQNLIKEETTATFENGVIVQHTPDKVIAAIKSFKLSQGKWLESDIKKLPDLLALIFGLWSLQKPEHMLRKQQQEKDLQIQNEESKDEDLRQYLNQPHPAQVLGIMRILGAGYNPNEFMKFDKDDKKKSQSFGDSPQAFQARIRNNLVQIKTGEGKSVTLAVLSIIFALCGFDVRCACYSNYLSERDFKAFSGMFAQLGLIDRIKYSTFNKLCEMELNKDGNLRDIVTDLILVPPQVEVNPEKKNTVKREANPRPQVLLIDEVDVFFQDGFFGNHYMPRALIKGPQISALTDFIWDKRDQQMTLQDVKTTSEEYKQACHMFKPDYQFLLEEAVKQMLRDVKGVDKYELGKLIGGKIQYKVGDTWSDAVTDGYNTLFAYYYNYHKDASNPGRESVTEDTLVNNKAIGVNCAKFSYAEGPLSYSLILGLTGTLDTLSTEQLKIMKSVYNLSSKTYAPSAYDLPKGLPKDDKNGPLNKIEGLKEEILIMNEAQEKMYEDSKNTDEVEYVNEMTIKILATKDDWFRFIDGRIEEGLKTKNTAEEFKGGERAVIVFFADDVILKEYKTKSQFINRYDSSKVDVLTEKDDKDVKTSKVSNATNQGHITLLTREFGRGTDFKYQGDLVINAGGLLVIQTFYTNDYSEEIQIRGRTRRQGTTGSYELIVQREDLEACFNKEEVASIIESFPDPEKRYKVLHSKRQKIFEEAQNSKLKKRNDLKDLHTTYAQNVENIKRTLEKQAVTVDQKEAIRKMLLDLNSCQVQGSGEVNLVKALVLIDATGSMGALLENAKNSIQLYFDTVCKSLKDSKYPTNIFKLQMAFYRNYSSGMRILEKSEWTGPDEVEALKEFLKDIKANGGQGDEAVEIGLLHANREIYEPEDKVPVSLIYVIGDAPGNASLADINKKKKYNNKGDEHKAWNKEEEKAFGKSNTWDKQLERIKQFRDGIIPIYSFYLEKKIDDTLPKEKKKEIIEKNQQLDAFFAKIRINNKEGDEGGLIDVTDEKNKAKLAELFCKYTIRMIAKKNPNSGDQAKLINLSNTIQFI